MKTTLAILSVSMLLSTASYAKIVSKKGEYFIETKNGKSPIMNVNEMIEKKAIKNIQTYGEGKAHLISFAKKDGPVMLYSVDEKGFIYSIKPFSGYTVSSVDADGKFQFKEDSKHKYMVDSKGFFLH